MLVIMLVIILNHLMHLGDSNVRKSQNETLDSQGMVLPMINVSLGPIQSYGNETYTLI